MSVDRPSEADLIETRIHQSLPLKWHNRAYRWFVRDDLKGKLSLLHASTKILVEAEARKEQEGDNRLDILENYGFLMANLSMKKYIEMSPTHLDRLREGLPKSLYQTVGLLMGTYAETAEMKTKLLSKMLDQGEFSVAKKLAICAPEAVAALLSDQSKTKKYLPKLAEDADLLKQSFFSFSETKGADNKSALSIVRHVPNVDDFSATARQNMINLGLWRKKHPTGRTKPQLRP